MNCYRVSSEGSVEHTTLVNARSSDYLLALIPKDRDTSIDLVTRQSLSVIATGPVGHGYL
jgi:hypothetical protein